jgi:hypothetical protein
MSKNAYSKFNQTAGLLSLCLAPTPAFRRFMQREDTASAAVAHPNAPLTPRDFIDKKTETTKRLSGIPYIFLKRHDET